MKPVSLRRALEDPRLLGGALPGPCWATWRALLIASRGEPLTEAERELVAAVIGDREPPSAPVREFETVAGRRSGKDAAAAHWSIIPTFCGPASAAWCCSLARIHNRPR